MYGLLGWSFLSDATRPAVLTYGLPERRELEWMVAGVGRFSRRGVPPDSVRHRALT